MTFSANSTYGNYSHVHTTSGHTLTVDEIPSHKHKFQDYLLTNGGQTDCGIGSNFWRPTGRATETLSTGGGKSHSHGNTGSSSNIQPSIVVYFWRRTA